MLFENLWPLALVACVPLIILLYLLRPKGTNLTVPSNLIWRKLAGVNKRAAFWEKLIHDPLMYLEILIMLLLIGALMSPLISMHTTGGKDTVIVLDTSGSMQMRDGNTTRFARAKEYALAYLEQCRGNVTLIAADSGAHLLASASSDHGRLKRLLQQTQVTDLAGNLEGVRELILSQQADRVVVLTDGNGALRLSAQESWQVLPFGEKTENLAAADCSLTGRDAIVLVQSYGESDAVCDVTLYDPAQKILATRQVRVPASGMQAVLFEELPRVQETEYISVEISQISFEDGGEDALEKDNLNFIFPEASENVSAALIGSGNRFIEKAYEAVTGEQVTRLENETLLKDERIVIFDAVKSPDQSADTGEDGSLLQELLQENAESSAPLGVMRFASAENSMGEKTGCVVSFVRSELTTGIEEGSFGVNETRVLDVPKWGTAFLMSEDQCVGYYGCDPSGIRRIAVGFDIRESNLPVMAEFPIWFANSLQYLSDSRMLGRHLYFPGEPLLINPSAASDAPVVEGDTDATGLYQLETDQGRESYGVVFPYESESDGRITAQTLSGTHSSSVLLRRSIRRGLIVAAILLLLADLCLYVRMSRYRGRLLYVLRAVIGLLLLAALFDIRLPNRMNGRATIFLADLSDSNRENVAWMEEYIRRQVEAKPASDQFGLVTFGQDAVIDQFLTRNKQFAGIMTSPVATATDVEAALSRAVSMIPDGAGGRIVMLTDGRQTRGKIENMRMVLEESGIELCGLFTDTRSGDDAYIKNASMPTRLHPGDSFRLNVAVESSFETDAEITISSKSRKLETKKVHLEKGESSFAFAMQVTGQESENFRVTITAPGDGCRENDSYYLYADVSENDRMLVISGMNTDSSQLLALLGSANEEADTVSAKNAPASLSEMMQYKAMLLDNVYISDLPEGFLENLESYIRDYGGGLIVSGGEDSFALGGYRDTVLEKVLPVDMEPRGVNEMPSMALVMVIDRSGSMTMTDEHGTDRLSLALEAACRAVDNLGSKDSVGVVVFDENPEWQVPLVPAADKKRIKEAIRQTDGGGGTMIFPALQEAYETIYASDASIKHLLLLTDGEGETKDFRLVSAALNRDDITLSCVAVGQDSDQTLLQNLAEACNGRYYYSDSQSDIPRIFAKEVLMSGESYLQNGDFALTDNGMSEITGQLFEEGLPHITGYVSASPKAGAVPVLESDKQDPVLSVWQYGLGHTVAWNTDTGGIWTGGFVGKDDYVEMWRRICDYAFGAETDLADRIETQTDESGRTIIRYLTEEYSGEAKVEGVYTTPSGLRKEISLTQKKPGEFEAALDETGEGIYYLNLRKTEKGRAMAGLSTAAVLQFSEEYRFDVTDRPVKHFVEENGRLLSEEESVWTRMQTRMSTGRSIVLLLLTAAAVLFLLDIVMRRLELERVLLAMWGTRKPAAKAQSEAPSEPVGGESTEQAAKKPDQAVQKVPVQTQVKESEQRLDTSLLLKKKRDRSGGG